MNKITRVLVLVAAVCCGLVLEAGHCSRVKRIVGGEKAAIPKPLDFAAGVKAALTAESAKPKPSTSGKTTTEPPRNRGVDGDDRTVAIYEEEVTAKIEGIKEDDGSVSFKGLRYANPPIEKNRFQRPILVHPKGDVKAHAYGSPCLQSLPDGSKTVGSEDCLFLNIHTPSVYVKNASGLPVLFWIHGGGFTSGSGNQYGTTELVKKNVVVVTINYRLGSLGFLGSRDQQMAGNAGLFDVRAAFEWTRRYIAYFGGDHRKIFTGGQGNGASLAMLLAQSDFTAGYLKGVFAMSGTGISSNAVDYKPGNTSTFIAKSSNCVGLTPLKTLRCLQTSTSSSLFNVDKALQADRIGDGGFVNAVSKLLSAGPIVEGKNDGRFLPYFLHDNPLDALKKKKTSKVPLLIGTTKTETGKALKGKFKDDVLKKLKIPNFLDKVLPKALTENNVGLFVGKIASQLINLLLEQEKYLQLFSFISKGLSEIDKVVEATTDALFNLPASTTSQLWETAGGESYFYSFEHQSSKSPSKHFLEGLNMFAGAPAPSKDESAGSSHGDDLLYLFELQTLEGKPLPEASLKDPKDLKVKTLFINVVSTFLHTGKPKIAELKENWPQFKTDHSYAIISDKPRYEKKFRYCQVALWGGFVDKLQDSFCNLPGINDLVNKIPKNILKGGILNPDDTSKIFEAIHGKLDKIVPPLPSLPIGTGVLPGDNKNVGILLLPGGNKKNEGSLFGGAGGIFGSNSKSSDPRPSQTTTKKPGSSLGLPGLGGFGL